MTPGIPASFLFASNPHRDYPPRRASRTRSRLRGVGVSSRQLDRVRRDEHAAGLAALGHDEIMAVWHVVGQVHVSAINLRLARNTTSTLQETIGKGRVKVVPFASVLAVMSRLTSRFTGLPSASSNHAFEGGCRRWRNRSAQVHPCRCGGVPEMVPRHEGSTGRVEFRDGLESLLIVVTQGRRVRNHLSETFTST